MGIAKLFADRSD